MWQQKKKGNFFVLLDCISLSNYDIFSICLHMAFMCVIMLLVHGNKSAAIQRDCRDPVIPNPAFHILNYTNFNKVIFSAQISIQIKGWI